MRRFFEAESRLVPLNGNRKALSFKLIESRFVPLSGEKGRSGSGRAGRRREEVAEELGTGRRREEGGEEKGSAEKG